MDAIQLLTSDHENVRKLFDQFRSAAEEDDESEMRSIQEQIFDELETHTRIEEQVFYPAIRDLDGEELDDTVDESLQEHHVVDVLMREIRVLKDLDVYKAKMTVLIENVEHHADEEEDEMFPDVRERMSQEELDELGSRLKAAKSG